MYFHRGDVLYGPLYIEQTFSQDFKYQIQSFVQLKTGYSLLPSDPLTVPNHP